MNYVLDPDKLYLETISITTKAGEIVMEYFISSYSVKEKRPDNPVTDADMAADQYLKEKLLELLPEAGWLSEETADSKDRLARKYTWVVDPLDGTKEFIQGIPEFVVSVALVEDQRPLIGVIYNPAAKELFHAMRGRGTYRNQLPVNASDTLSLQAARVDASRSERKRGEFEPFEELVKIQTVGSVAYKMARLSAGLCDATWSRGPKNEWDICAGVLLVEESGGKVVNLDNQPFLFNRPNPKVNGLIATNDKLHGQVISALAPHRDSARVD